MTDINYSWKIESFLKKDTENLKNVIFSITWTRTAVDSTNNTTTSVSTASVSSTIALELPVNADGFVPYEKLTEQNIIDWLDENIDQEKLNKRLWDQIEYNRSLVQPTNFPWN